MSLAADLHIVTPIANPMRWKSRIRHAYDAILSWVDEPNVQVWLPEVAYGKREHELDHLKHPRVHHIALRAETAPWSKENLINLAISRIPLEAHYIGTFDADIHFRRQGWAEEVCRALDHHPVIQPWSVAHDLGPRGEHLHMHHSLCKLYRQGKPVAPGGPKFWRADGGPYDYAHSGFAWAYTRDFLNAVGGLFELGGMGSGDYHMALGLVGRAECSMPAFTSHAYKDAVFEWQARAQRAAAGNIGFVECRIEHLFHGRKVKRNYIGRWDIFVKHQFNPHTDLKRNTQGVVEWAGNKPHLERDWYAYLYSREEDANTLE